jgi:DNA-binding NtrC family response regulator/PAS domain-containing protein
VDPSERPSRDADGQRLEFETLVSDTSARLLAATAGELDAAVESALERVMLFFDADRAGLLAVQENGSVNISHKALRPGLTAPPSTVDLAQWFPWSAHRLLVEREPSYTRTLDELPEQAAADRAAFSSMGTRTSLTVPIFRAGAVGHLIVVHAVRCECHWWGRYVPRLRLLGEMFLAVLDRRHAFEALSASQRQLERAATAGRCGLWDLNTATGHIWATNIARVLYGFVPDQSVTWAEVVETLHPDDREYIAGRVEEVAATGGRFDERHRVVLPDGTVRWLHVIGEHAGACRLEGASVDVTSIMETERRAQEALLEVTRLRDRLESENVYLRHEVRRRGSSEPIVGRSPAIRDALALADRVARTDSTVLLLGETGAGKERFANYIHESSRRRDHTMIRVNCSAIPLALIESELFGREKGAFTGAASRQLGRFELAHGSTLFLDEVGDLPPEVQVKLLRVLEEGTIERLGSPRPIRVDVRIIAATHRDLKRMVASGTYREDLYYRLNVFPVAVPPLRHRLDDIPLLVEALIEELAPGIGKRISGIAPASLEALRSHTWPGNVRELRNVIERAMILSATAELRIEAAFSETPGAPPQATAGEPAPDRERVLEVMRDTGWRIRGARGAAARLGLKPTTLEARMRRLGITRPGSQ